MVHTKSLERAKFLAITLSEGDYNDHMSVPHSVISDLSWWKNMLPNAMNPIRQFSFVKEAFSDASKIGYGSSCEDESVHCFWNEEERLLHFNFLELLAAFWALKSFADNLRDCEILLRVDNTTAIAYINKMGGIEFPHLNSLSRVIWDWCQKKNIWIFAPYIASKDNIEADKQSRIKNLDTEWKLASFAYNKIVKVFSIPEIDLFASVSKFRAHYSIRCQTELT